MKNQSPKYQNIYIELKNFTTDLLLEDFTFLPLLAGVGGWEDGREFINKYFRCLYSNRH